MIIEDCPNCVSDETPPGCLPCARCTHNIRAKYPTTSYFRAKEVAKLRSRLALAEALIETIENVYPDICDMAQYRAWKEAGR